MTSGAQRLRTFFARGIQRWQTIYHTLRGGEEDRYKIVCFIVSKLPLSNSAKRKVIVWSLNHVTDRERRTLRSQVAHAQQQWDAKGHKRLQELFAGGDILNCQVTGSPDISFILILHNKAHLSLLSIESILKFAESSYQLILVDNGSTDLTSALLDRLGGATILRNPTNVGFGPACMQAAAAATGEYLCFLNNDVLLTKGAISAALKNLEKSGVGAVGGKILLANGSLQEAGSIVWSDGSALGYGRGDDPELPQYNFRRPVDYCSGVFLVTPRKTFEQLGGFSAEFAPAYYEDTDYSMKLWRENLSVIYEPLAQILHYESATSEGNEFAATLMASHQVKFRNKWMEVLKQHYDPAQSNICAARISVNSRSLRILYIDDRIPERALGAGFPRSNDIVREFVRMGCHVVCSTSTYPLLGEPYHGIPQEVELFDGFRFRDKLINEYMRCADIVWVSRPRNLKSLLTEHREALADRQFALVYDAEAIFSQRTADRALLLGEARKSSDLIQLTGPEEEFALARAADCVCVVSETDREGMVRAGVETVFVVGHRMPAARTTTPFAERDTFLFVGSVHGFDNPNADSIRYFCDTMWAKIHRITGAMLVVAGYGSELLLTEVRDPTVKILGAQDELRPLYERARVFVVPTRYAAGIPFKAHEAAGFGVPLVVSELIARQMKWIHGVDYYAASSPDEFAEGCVRVYQDEALWQKLRTNALARVETELSPDVFTTCLRSVLKQVVPSQVTNLRDRSEASVSAYT